MSMSIYDCKINIHLHIKIYFLYIKPNLNLKAVLHSKISMTFLSFTKSKINHNN